ncbi:MAG: hybrid sensor histidine kinase/response regulator [Bacteroidales bacterium]|nr:hybrid sensor histidine kinase/response regulator [Bacteroidales bacterium]
MKTHKILIVDDDYQNLQLLYAYLNEINPSFNVIKTNRSEKAMKLAKSRLPDLIITDWEMPSISGLDLIMNLKADAETKEIPVIMLTGIMLASENLRVAFEAGATDFISKPITKNELSARINSVLKLSDSFKEIKRLNATKDKFFSIIAHDLAEPFNGLLGITEMLKDNVDNYPKEKIKQLVNLLHKSAEQNFRLLNNLLQWSRAQQGSIPYDPEKILLKKLFPDIAEIFKTTSINKNIAFETGPENDLFVYADKNMLTSTLNNLINNAFKYTKEKGKVILSTVKHDEFVEFIVSDSGVGISNSDMNKLFRLDTIHSTPGTNDEKGTGLGLILCKEFIEKNNGKIWVESKLKRGTKFHFTIPIS